MTAIHFFTRRFSVLLICLFTSISAFSQNAYQKGWESLNNANVSESIEHFEAALEDPVLKEDALLCLTLLYSQGNQEKKASKLFNQYLDLSDNPYPVLYSMWFEKGVSGETGKKKPHQLKLLKKLEKDKLNKGKLDGGTTYRLGFHNQMAMEKKRALDYFDKIKNIKGWIFLGPFDNVMNSGYDKDFGVVAHPEAGAMFTSKYGAEVTWFDPVLQPNDVYVSKKRHFVNNNSIIYAQTFIEAPKENEVLLKFGYSGTLKLWINDSLIYNEPEHRVTEMDYYRFKCKLNKGYNRILVQLGDYQESYPNFILRFTDLKHNPISLSNTNAVQPYQKLKIEAERIPYFAIEALEKKAKEKDTNLLYKVLLAKAYMRARELDKAEDVLKSAHEIAPDNYFILRNLVLLYNKGDESTNQNKYYELFKENYPQDINILENEIDENKDKKDKEKVIELIDIYNSKYPDPFSKMSYDLTIASMEEDNDLVLALVDSLFDNFPETYYSVITKYKIEKSYYSNPEKANKILEKYLKTNYSNDIFSELASNYLNEGDVDKVIDLLNQKIDLFPYDISSYRQIVNLLTRKKEYKEAIEVCNKIIENRPSDYRVLSDIAILYKYLDNTKSAIRYYEESLRYSPFSFETNEKIRELKEQQKAVDIIPEVDPEELILDYEKNFTPSKKRSYDIVFESRSLIVFKSKAQGIQHSYVLKINDESAIETWQNVSFSASSNMRLYIDEVKTIKKNGNKIDAERSSGEVVFTNLEIGDYIYISYYEKQTYGGKSSVFISDRQALNYSLPAYKVEYNLLAEDGLVIQDTILNDNLKPEISTLDGFTKYSWKKTAPEVIKDESYTIPFNDITQKVHISLGYTWRDIVQWYSDLSTQQAAADYTIKTIVNDLFDGKELSENEKAKIIYDFVCKNIQYSSVDFRQSNYIPQKASRIYHARLGDCKDVSTLYVSLAREAGLEANMVLINTSDNGENDVVLPSLNFNHCMVKVYLDEGEKFLELTDPNLPYGHLYYYHKGAAILEIPTKNLTDDIQLAHLDLNPGYQNVVVREKSLRIGEDFKMNIKIDNIKTGTKAASTCHSFYNIGEEEIRDKLKKAIASNFKSELKFEDFNFEILEPLNDTAKYSYSFTVENDVIKIGSFRTFKIPFSDLLIEMSVFDDSERKYEFNYVYYENTDRYDEIMKISIPEKHLFMEVPENIHLEYNDCVYDLTFEQLDDSNLKVHRIFKVNRVKIAPEDFLEFKAFMTKVNEAENTHLLFK